MRMAFLAKYADFGLLLLRVSVGVLFILYTAPALMGGPSAWAHFGVGARNWGIHSHFQIWGFVAALLGCIGSVFRTALPSIEMCFVLAGVLFIGPGKYSADKT